MSYFKAKIHQIRFRLGLRSRLARGGYRAPPSPLTGFKGATSKRRGGKGGEVSEGGEDEKGEVKRRGGKRGECKKGRGGRREIKERKNGSVPESFSQILAAGSCTLIQCSL